MQLLDYAQTTLLFSDRYTIGHRIVSVFIELCMGLVYEVYCYQYRGVDVNVISWNRVILLHGEFG